MEPTKTQQNEKAPAPGPGPLRPRVANACEACRFAKVKCQGSSQVGICKRCLASKRECIFKTGPRTRRPRGSRVTANQGSSITTNDTNTRKTTTTATESTIPATVHPSHQDQPHLPSGPPPPGPSRTFTIDVPIPTASVDVAICLESLRLDHEGFMDNICPPGGGSASEGDDDYYGYEHEIDDDGNWVAARGGGDASESPGPASVISSHASSLPLGASAATPTSSCASGFAPLGGGGGTLMNPNGNGKLPGGEGGGGRGQRGGGGKRSTSSLASLSVQPQFNVDSASRLLDTFRTLMLWHFPCVLVDHVVYDSGYDRGGEVKLEEATVGSLARERPFVLLAVLAAASSTRTLQGHSLYDEEFRKILGLKFVAGGERSLELLQGLAVYVAWYPFHLRPKNRQAFQYVRMAVDMVNDLELDMDPGVDELNGTRRPTSGRLEEIRTYLATYYVASNFATSWNRTPSMSFTNYTAKCCDILEKYSITKGDRILPWLVRLQRLCEETNNLRRPQRGGVYQPTESQIETTIKGMEAQLNEWEAGKMPSDLKSVPSIRITTIFTRLFLTGAPLLKLPSVKLRTSPVDKDSPFRVDANRLSSLIPTLHENFEYFLSLSAHEINAFSMIGWGCLILSTILGFRISFPISYVPEWDDFAARRVVRFDGYLERLCRLGSSSATSAEETKGKDGKSNTTIPMPTTKGMDVLSASKVVFAVVRRKFRNRVAKLEGAAALGKGRGRERDTQMGGVDVGGVCPVTGKMTGEGVHNPHNDLGQQHHFQPQQQPPYHHQNQDQHAQTSISQADFTTTTNNHPSYQHPQTQNPNNRVLDTHMHLPMLPLDLPVPGTPSSEMEIPPLLDIPSTNMSGCPMMDGSLEPYYPYWDETFAFNPSNNHHRSTVVTSSTGLEEERSPSVANSGRSGDTTRNHHGAIASEEDSIPQDMGMGFGMGFDCDVWDTMTTDWAAAAAAAAGYGGFGYVAGDGRVMY